MLRYLSKSFKDTIELSIQQSISANQNLNRILPLLLKPQNKNDETIRKSENRNFPEGSLATPCQETFKDKNKDDFKKKYNRLKHEERCFLGALKWASISEVFTWCEISWCGA